MYEVQESAVNWVMNNFAVVHDFSVVAVTAVLDYLNMQNRPYSAVDIFNNLHKEYGKVVSYISVHDIDIDIV